MYGTPSDIIWIHYELCVLMCLLVIHQRNEPRGVWHLRSRLTEIRFYIHSEQYGVHYHSEVLVHWFPRLLTSGWKTPSKCEVSLVQLATGAVPPQETE